MNIIIFLLLLFGFSLKYSLAIAAQPFIQIKQPNKSIGLIDFQEKALGQMSIEIILKNGKYQLLLNQPKLEKTTKIKYYQLQYTINKKEKLQNDQIYDLEYKIINLKNNKTKKVVRKSEVMGRRFLYHSRFLLYQLFYGKSFVKKNRKKIEKEIRKNKQGPLTNIENLDIKKKEPSLPKKENLNKNALAYQNSIDKLKIEIDEKISKLGKKEKDKKTNNKSSKKKNLLANVANKNLSKDDNSKVSESTKVIKAYRYSLGYSFNSIISSNTISNTDIEIKSDFEFMNFGIEVLANLPNEKNHLLTGNVVLSRTLASDNYDIAAPFYLGAGYIRKFPNYNFLLKGKFIYSSQSFISIANEGSGLVPATAKIVWFNFATKYERHFLRKKVGLELGFKKSFVGTTDLLESGSNAAIEGSMFELSMHLQLFNRFTLTPSFSILNYSSSNSDQFSVQDKSVAIHLLYN